MRYDIISMEENLPEESFSMSYNCYRKGENNEKKTFQTKRDQQKIPSKNFIKKRKKRELKNSQNLFFTIKCSIRN